MSYQVSLSPDQEQRALSVYRKSFVIVSHTHCVEPWDFEEMQKAGITAAIVKLDIDEINMLDGNRSLGVPGEDWLARGDKEIHRINELAARPGSNILIVREFADLKRAKHEGRVGLILGFEGARTLGGKLEAVEHYYDLGMRELQPFFAVQNEIKTADGTQLSALGVKVIREMNRLGIVLDVELMSSQAFAQAIALAKAPVIISHAAVEDLDQKGEDDDPPYHIDLLNVATIRAIARNGGTIGIHFCTPSYIKPRHGTQKATVVDLVDHIVFIRDLVGIDHVSLGVDFFPETGWHLVEGAGRISQFPNVAREMVRRGFSDEEVSKVLGGNLMRVFQANWKSR